MSEPFIGEIRIFAGNFAPRGWAFCNGQLLSIAQNTALFSLLGTTYGGNGIQTFGLPDLRGRVPVGFGQGPGLSNHAQGQQYGAEQVTLTAAQLPAHTHNLEAALPDPEPSLTPTPAVPTAYDQAPGSAKAAFPSSSAGGGQPVSVTQPTLTLNFIIALFGIYPSRS
ncbi:MAG: phage tail protein [Deltaproteobacteria bacterium HGW-Deltaproteobacteria-14]|jgi:microcystin-dependent protein|nr:MAG: phage tail protein [Deltaproteobacteria bacterium HGW-Deltaproteobacteria-14]